MIERLQPDVVAQARQKAAMIAGDETSPHALLSRMGEADTDQLDVAAQLRRFFLLVKVIEADADARELSATEVARHYELAQNLLKLMAVKPRSSRYSFLYSELDVAKAQLLMNQGQPWLAFAQLQSARADATRGAPPDLHPRLALASVRCLARLGHIDAAVQGMELPLMDALPQEQKLGLWLERMTLARWLGQKDIFATLKERCMAATGAVDPRTADRLRWELLADEATRTGDVKKLVTSLGRRQAAATAQPTFMAMLWGLAARSSISLPGFPNVESVRRHYALSLREQTDTSRLLKIVKVIEECHDGQIPLVLRIQNLDEALTQLKGLRDPEAELLALAAAARWLRGVQQSMRATVVLAEYRRLSRLYANGQRDDLLGLVADLKQDAWEKFAEDPEPAASATALRPQAMPRTAGGRAMVVTKVGLGVLPRLLRRRVRSLFSRQAGGNETLDEETINYLVQHIGNLKGPIVKLAQMTAFMHAALPEPVYQAITRLRDDSPPVSAAVIRAVVKAELGDDAFTTKFAAWQDEPIAAASVGQVHRATMIDGTNVIVKIQYPGIEEAMRADLRMLRLIVLPLYRWLFPAVDLVAVADAVEKQTHRECDYKAEAEAQETVRQQYLNHPVVIVPKVFPALSTQRVLTMEYVEGRRFADFCRASDQDERNTVAANLTKALLGAMLEGRPFSADPHPGNFLFTADGRIAMLDFGATASVTPERIKVFKSVVQAVTDGNAQAFREGMIALGYVGDPEAFDFETEMRGVRLILAPLLSQDAFQYSFEFISEVFTHYGLGSANRRQIRFDSQDVPLWRFMFGWQVLMCELEAKAKFGEIFWQAALRSA